MSKARLSIDPGHGMGNRQQGVYDPGAVDHGVSEADVVLLYALAIKFVFKQAGYDVFLTRDDASDVTPVGSRNDKAEAAGCTHFISLHMNAGGGTGTETYYRGADDHVWALKVQAAALRAFDLHNRGLKTENESQHSRLAVLDFKGPGCLCELGFIDSPKDRVLISTRDSRVKFAQELLKVWQGIAS